MPRRLRPARTLTLAALLATALCMPAAATPAETAPIVAAERAFSALAGEIGWVAAFKANAAPDGIMIHTAPVNAQAQLAKFPEGKDDPALVWWPVHAGMARSGDMGFTTGPFTIGDRGFGHFFTVWVKQPDGSWKWIFDGGPRQTEKSALGPDTVPTTLPPSTAAAGSAEEAMAQVRTLEAALATDAETDSAAALRRHLAADARVMGSLEQPGTTPDGVAAELARRAPSVKFAALGGRASAAGDLVFTYGSADWSHEGQARRGHYVRIWQNRAAGWALVFDQILPPPPPPPKPQG